MIIHVPTSWVHHFADIIMFPRKIPIICIRLHCDYKKRRQKRGGGGGGGGYRSAVYGAQHHD